MPVVKLSRRAFVVFTCFSAAIPCRFLSRSRGLFQKQLIVAGIFIAVAQSVERLSVLVIAHALDMLYILKHQNPSE